jgi:hypothetical protein
LLQIDVTENVAHEADEPNAVVYLLDSKPLTGEHGGDVDLLAMHADAAACGDQHVAIVKGIIEVGRGRLSVNMSRYPGLSNICIMY